MLADPDDPAPAAGGAPPHVGRADGGSAAPGPSVPPQGSRPPASASVGHAVLDELAAHPRGDDLARLVHTLAFAAADERRPSLSNGLAEAAERAGLKWEDGETRYGNVLRALERGGSEGAGSATRALLSTALARGVALSPPSGAEAEERVVESLTWLATHTHVDALPALDAALGQRADGFWLSAGALVRRADAGKAPLVGRAGALIATAALVASGSPAARSEVIALVDDVRDPIVRSLLRGNLRAPDAAVPMAFSGEVVPAPRGPVALLLLGVTGILVVTSVARLILQLVLRYRRPAELRVSSRGVTVVTRTLLLGRTLREREVHMPVEALARATREVRYPRLALYAGLFALAIGSYFGTALFVDGARAGSPELLGIGALVVAVGVALDYALVHLFPGGKARCRVVLLPRRGPAVAIGLADRAHIDAALASLTGR